MAYGTELLIGWLGKKDVEPAAKSFGLDIDWKARDAVPETTLSDIHSRLLKIYSAAVLDLPHMTGYTAKERRDGILREFNFYKAGSRTIVTRPWDCYFYYDPRECGDTPESAAFGVSLVTRYKPCFLDLDDEYGGSGCPIGFTSEVLNNIEVAKRHLIAEFPQFETAYVCIKEMHY